VLKRLASIGTTLALLLGSYYVYVHAFEILVDWVRATRRSETTVFAARDSRSKLEAIAIAKAAFGPHHWSSDSDLAYRYYSAERGFWMYAKQVWRIVEEDGVKYDGKRLRMAPFALVSRSRDGRVTKTIVSDEAVFDLNESLSLKVASGGDSLKIKHARIERNVLIRDDHGTPGVPDDDMTIGPLTTLEYDESTRLIKSPSDVLIQDQTLRITGRGLEITLREPGPGNPGGGVGGAKTLILLENVHVMMQDVGKSGLLPGSVDARRVGPGGGQEQVAVTGPGMKSKTEPTPLDLRSDGPMRVDLPPPATTVDVGPPEPAKPTFVQFDRNVVVLRGAIDKQPDQMTCDTLRLTLVPRAAAAPSARSIPAPGSPAVAASSAGLPAPPESPAAQTPDAPSGDDGGVFGNLALERAHATGHAVWLFLPASGVKLRCNELIHKKQAPRKPDETYFRGDLTRPLELDKVDLVYPEDGKGPPKVAAVTHIWTIDATLFDDGSGAGLDAADVVAHGPGRLETRPDRDQPVDRVAVWQDKMVLLNELDQHGQVKQKIVDLTGSRPSFSDHLQSTQLDSARLLRIWLKPKPAEESLAQAAAVGAAQGRTATANSGAAPPASPAGGVGRRNPQTSGAGLGGRGFQIDRLLAYRDVHLSAPSRVMAARDRLDAEFVEEKPAAQPALAAPRDPPDQVAEQPDDAPEAAESTEKPLRKMYGSADRIWARVAILPDPPRARSATLAPAPAHDANRLATADPPANSSPKPSASKPGGATTRSEIRKVWLFGSVAVHQDPAPGKTQADEAYGEAMYFENLVPNHAITHIYHRDPTENPPRPGPLPLALVINEDRSIKGEIIRVDQADDRVNVDGPGVSTQLADRAFLSDKAPEPEETDDSHSTDQEKGQTLAARTVRTTAAPGSSGAGQIVHTTAPPQTGQATEAAPEQAATQKTRGEAKPKTRAGKALSQKTPFTITWTKRMEFFGRSRDPDDNPAAKAVFYGKVRADMEDGVLQCEDHMITYTDREIPLASLGALSQTTTAQPAQAEEKNSESKPELTLVECFQKAVAINRKVDPDRPIELQRQMVQGDYLRYDRRTGEFYVPGRGYVHLYERENPATAANAAAAPGENHSDRASNGRVVTPTSAAVPRDAARAGRSGSRATANAATKPARKPGDKPGKDEIPPLVLTQIKFTTGMRGRFGTGKSTDVTETRWAEFFGNVETVRAKVADVHSFLKPDKLPKDGMFLTGQTLRVITEPPPPGSPPNTPARNYLKAWEKAYVWSQDKTLQADVVTYDSYKDLIYAYGENGRGVVYAQQYAVGQPTSPNYARAVQLNPRTGGAHLIDGSTIQTIDQRTGVRPNRIEPPDPHAKPKKKRKKPPQVPFSNMERRDFTGQ